MASTSNQVSSLNTQSAIERVSTNMGLLATRGTATPSASNTSLTTALQLGSFQSSRSLSSNALYNGTVSTGDPQDYYQFNLADPSKLNILLSGATPNVEMQLLDSAGNAVSLLTPSGSDGTRVLSGDLAAGTYYVRVFARDNGVGSYSMSLYNGTVYYVSPTGSNQATGSFDAPFQTIQFASNRARAGDVVLMREGRYLERSIRLQQSGTETLPITLAATPGETVVIDHSLPVSQWTRSRDNIFVGTPTFPNPTLDLPENTQRVVVNDRALVAVGSPEELVEGTFWVNRTTGEISVWAFDGVDPNTVETTVLNRTPERQPGIRAFNVNHIVLDGFINTTAEIGIWAANFEQPQGTNRDITIRNVEVKYGWQGGIRFDNWQGALVENSNVRDNGQENFPRSPGVIWPTSINGFTARDIVIQRNRIHSNHGEGVGPFLKSSDWKILNNVVYDNWSVNIYVDTDIGNVLVDGNFVYNTGRYSGGQRDNPDGIRIANEAVDILRLDTSVSVSNITVTNNVITNTGGGIQSFPYSGPYYLKDSLIANNTIGPLTDETDGITVIRGDNVRVINNLVYPSRIVLRDGIGSGIIADNNFVRDAQASVVAGQGVTVSNTRSGDPLYAVGTGLLADNYRPQTGSPVFGGGTPLPQVVRDFAAVLRPTSGAIAIGAFEGVGTASSVVQPPSGGNPRAQRRRFTRDRTPTNPNSEESGAQGRRGGTQSTERRRRFVESGDSGLTTVSRPNRPRNPESGRIDSVESQPSQGRSSRSRRRSSRSGSSKVLNESSQNRNRRRFDRRSTTITTAPNNLSNTSSNLATNPTPNPSIPAVTSSENRTNRQRRRFV